MSLAKRKERIQRRLGALRQENGHGKCWTCDSIHGVKTSREGYGTRCTRCIEQGKTNEAVEEYDRLKAELDRLNRGSG